MAQFSFDTNSVEKREINFDLLPAGWYTAQVIDSEIVPLRSGNGQAIKLTFSVLSEGFVNRRVWARLNVRHSNPEAERIAQQQLRELCEAVGIARMNDTAELHNKPVQIKVKVRKDETGAYEDQNEVNGFKPVGGASSSFAPSQGFAKPANASVAAPAGGTPPWAKRAA